MASSRILLIFALCALASIATASTDSLRFRKFLNYANSSNHTNYTAAFYQPTPLSSNHSNHSNSSNTTNHTAAFYYPISISSNHSNHSNSSNTTNHAAAPGLFTFPSTPFFNFPAPSISSNHSNHSNHSNSTCTRVIAGQTFDLCAFNNPITTIFHNDQFAANFTFSLFNSSISDCNRTRGSSWMTVRNSYGACVDAHHSPAFNLTRQYGDSGLKIDYQLGGNDTRISVHLVCNRTAPHNGYLHFDFNRTSNSSMTMTAQSYYGCPVNSSVNASTNATIRDFGRKFFEF